MNYTDDQLKQVLAKMLPEKLFFMENIDHIPTLCWRQNRFVLDTELLHVCHLIEQTLDKEGDLTEPPELRESEQAMFINYLTTDMTALFDLASMTWQQRTIALAKVKGVKIV